MSQEWESQLGTISIWDCSKRSSKELWIDSSSFYYAANRKLENFIQTWCGMISMEAGLQFSINSTNDEQRRELFDNKSHSLATISEMATYAER